MRYAVRELGLSPEAFWRLSVAEWRMLTGAEAPLKREELAALMQKFPDGDGMSRTGRLAQASGST